jgi:hypothetical protein
MSFRAGNLPKTAVLDSLEGYDPPVLGPVVEIPQLPLSRLGDVDGVNRWIYIAPQDWPMGRVLMWLIDNGFSSEWQETMRSLNLHGSNFLCIGSSSGILENVQVAVLKAIRREMLSRCLLTENRLDENLVQDELKRLEHLVWKVLVDYENGHSPLPSNEEVRKRSSAIPLSGSPRAEGEPPPALSPSGRTSPSRRVNPHGQAFPTRYDFGASLSVALSNTQTTLGDRSGLTLKDAAKADSQLNQLNQSITPQENLPIGTFSPPNGQAELDALIDLKVLSPSPEVEGDLFFKSIPAVTTVGELKLKIRDKIVTRPAIERMRLIYRGMAMARDKDSMFEVFGRDNLCLCSFSRLPYANGLSRFNGRKRKPCTLCSIYRRPAAISIVNNRLWLQLARPLVRTRLLAHKLLQDPRRL